MISSTENKQYRHRAAPFMVAVDTYKALLAAHNLTFSVDAAAVLTQYRTQLFAPLLAADKGLKMRWELLKTDAARVALVNATIDLTGYELADAVAAQLAALRETYRRQAHNWGVSMYSWEGFALQYQLDVPAVLDSMTVDLSDKQDIVAFLARYRTLLEEARTVFVAAGYLDTSSTARDAALVVMGSYDDAGQVKETAVWQLSTDLTRKGKRGIIPTL